VGDVHRTPEASSERAAGLGTGRRETPVPTGAGAGEERGGEGGEGGEGGRGRKRRGRRDRRERWSGDGRKKEERRRRGEHGAGTSDASSPQSTSAVAYLYVYSRKRACRLCRKTVYRRSRTHMIEPGA